jgi:Protein of unknown function (DUF3500)
MKTPIKLFLALLVTFYSCSSNQDEGSNAGSIVEGKNPEAIVVTTCQSSTGINKIICLTDALKAQLEATQLATLQRTYSVEDAKKWSNLPQQLVSSSNKRIGLSFGSMTNTQIQYAKALIKEIASTVNNEGYAEIQQIINADEYILANGGGSMYGASNYYIALLGTPSATGTFEIQFGGHHLAVANTYTNGQLVGATPSFRSSEPFGSFSWNNTTNIPLVQEKDALSAMLNGLNATQLLSAKLSGTVTDLVVGPQKDGQFPVTPSGIAVSTLTAAQKQLVLDAIKTYVNDVNETDATTLLAEYTTEIDQTYISYSGNTSLTTQNDYVRIDGPSVWIEYSCQRGIVFSATHPHSVWRDKSKDYGGN